jgi:hypothetical protein
MMAEATQPDFRTADECRQWLAAMSSGNQAPSLARLLRQLNLLNQSSLTGSERLAILQVLYTPLLQGYEAEARQFAGKALPLAFPEQTAFNTTQEMWNAVLKTCNLCIGSEMAHGVAKEAPLLAQIFYLAFVTLITAQTDAYRAGHMPTPEHWLALHNLYSLAEKIDVTGIEVTDTFFHRRKTPATPASAYIEAMLLDAAGPGELSLSYLPWIARWARYWSGIGLISHTPPSTDGKAVPLNIDLTSGWPGGRQFVDGLNARWLDTHKVERSLRKRLIQLEQGTPPQDLQLGADCTQPACGQILKHVYQCWCRGGESRRYRKIEAGIRCAIVISVKDIYFCFSGGQAFRPPGHSDDQALQRERDAIAVFDRVAPHNLDAPAQRELRAEEWCAVEEWQTSSVPYTFLHVTRSPDKGLQRITSPQLVAIRLPASGIFLIGVARWVMMVGNTSLHACIAIVPGKPEAIAVSITEASGAREPYQPGFLLPAMPAIAVSASIIAPRGTFRIGQVLELSGASHARLRATHLIDRGVDFDRIGFEPLA